MSLFEIIRFICVCNYFTRCRIATSLYARHVPKTNQLAKNIMFVISTMDVVGRIDDARFRKVFAIRES